MYTASLSCCTGSSYLTNSTRTSSLSTPYLPTNCCKPSQNPHIREVSMHLTVQWEDSLKKRRTKASPNTHPECDHRDPQKADSIRNYLQSPSAQSVVRWRCWWGKICPRPSASHPRVHVRVCVCAVRKWRCWRCVEKWPKRPSVCTLKTSNVT